MTSPSPNVEPTLPGAPATEESNPLASAAFGAKSNICVIMGRSSSGKTTSINMLKDMGFDVIPEVSRGLKERLSPDGTRESLLRVIEQDLGGWSGFVDLLIQANRETEGAIDPTRLVFSDLGTGDTINAARWWGVDTTAAEAAAKERQYLVVFHFEPLPFVENDGLRDMDPKLMEYLKTELPNDYRRLGYQLVSVPSGTREERVEFMLSYLRTHHPELGDQLYPNSDRSTHGSATSRGAIGDAAASA